MERKLPSSGIYVMYVMSKSRSKRIGKILKRKGNTIRSRKNLIHTGRAYQLGFFTLKGKSYQHSPDVCSILISKCQCTYVVH